MQQLGIRQGQAVKAKGLGRRALDEIETLVTPDTLLTLHRKLIAKKWTYPRKGLVTDYVLFVMCSETRSVNIAGVTTASNSAFMQQMARNLTDVDDAFL